MTENRAPDKLCHVRLRKLPPAVQGDEIIRIFYRLFPNCDARIYPFQWTEDEDLKQAAVSFILRKNGSLEDAIQILNAARPSYGPPGEERDFEWVAEDTRGNGISLVAESHPNPAFDCYFIHGLHGHPFGTFIRGDKLPSHGQPVFWPADWLPEKAESYGRLGRYFVFGYNTSLKRGKDFCPGIEIIARSLLESIKSTRKPGINRPIFLVGHSLGGLVACQAVVFAMDSDKTKPWYPYLYSTDGNFLIKGVSFLGTPFKGSTMASVLAPVVQVLCLGLSNNQLIRLRQEDKRTKAMLLRFEELRKKKLDPLFPLFIFWEEKKVIRNILGGRILLGLQIVKRESAEGYFDKHDKTIKRKPLRRDHRTMVKYTTKEKHLFEEVANPLLHFMMPSVNRGSNHSNSPILRGRTNHPAPEVEPLLRIRGQHQPSTNPVREFRIPDLAVLDGPSRIGDGHGALAGRSPSAVRKSSDKVEFITSLFDIRDDSTFFSDRSAYFTKPDPPLPGTCDWIHQKPLFQNWLDPQKDAVLFITGPVGRGKSVLAGYITKHVRDTHANSSSIVVPFYCRACVSSFRPIEVLKHIVFQIHKSFPDESERTINDFAEFGGTRATFKSLWALFIALRRNIRFTLFAIIDGIDEIIRREWSPEESEKLSAISDFLTSLCKELSTDGAEGIVKVLFISQPLSAIDQIDAEFEGKVLPINPADITPSVKQLVEVRLRDFFKARPLTEAQIDGLMDLVKKQSGDMFLYADRIINQIRKRVESHHAFDFYESLIKSYLPGSPPETEYLDEIYGATLREILNASDLSDAGKMNVILSLRVLFAAGKDLAPGVLSHLVGCAQVRNQHGDNTIKMSESSKIYRDAIPRAQDLVQELQHRCGNLVTVAEESVGFSHDTVRSYLARLDSPDLSGFSFRNEGDSNHFMACLCVDFLMAIGRTANGELEQREDDPKRRSHFLAALDFVSKNWSTYLRNISEEDLIGIWPAVCAIFQEQTSLTFTSRENLRIPPSFFLVSNNMGNILRLARLESGGKTVFGLGKPGKLRSRKRVHSQLPELKIDLNARDGKGNTILHHAALYGSTELDFLLQHTAVLRRTHGSPKNKDGETPFWKALFNFNESAAWKLIQAKEAERESKSRERWSSFQLAAMNGSAKLVAWFLQNGWNVDDDEGQYRQTALVVAVASENTATVTLLLERGANTLRQDEDGYTAFHIAAATGNVDILAQLLDTCPPTAQIPVNRWGSAPHFFAASNGHLKAFEVLHSRFPNVAPDLKGRLPAHYAAEAGQMAILKSPIIAQSLAAQDNFRWTPLHYAAKSKPLHAVKYCVQYSDKDCRALDHAAERSMPEDRQYCLTPLYIAVISGSEESAMFLLGLDASTKRTLSQGDTLLHLCAKSGLLGVCRHLLESEGLNPLVRNNYGQLPIHCAAANGHLNVFEYLHRFCHTQATPAYSIDLLDDEGRTALFYAIKASAISIVDFICEATTPNFEFTDIYQRTYLMAAANQTDVQMFQKVLQHTTSQINNTNIGGWTALHYAAMKGDLDIVNALLEKEANQMSEDITGDIPLTHATAYCQVTVANRLLSTGSEPFHCNKAGRSILSVVNESSPLWDSWSLIMPPRDCKFVSDEEAYQSVRHTIRQLFAELPKKPWGIRVLTGALFEMLRELTDRSSDTDIKVLCEYGVERLADGERPLPQPCFSCKSNNSTSAAHVCKMCWGFKLLCHHCFVQRSFGKRTEGCPPSHAYLEILDDAWFELEDGIVNEEGDCFHCFMDKIRGKYCDDGEGSISI